MGVVAQEGLTDGLPLPGDTPMQPMRLVPSRAITRVVARCDEGTVAVVASGCNAMSEGCGNLDVEIGTDPVLNLDWADIVRQVHQY